MEPLVLLPLDIYLDRRNSGKGSRLTNGHNVIRYLEISLQQTKLRSLEQALPDKISEPIEYNPGTILIYL